MNEEQDEGQEVNLISEGISFVSPKRPMDVVGLKKWVESLTDDMPQLLEEQNAAVHASEVFDAFVERYLTDKFDTVIPGWVVIDSKVLTKLTRGGLDFDAKIEIAPDVDHTLSILGMCPVLTLFHATDYIAHNLSNKGNLYLGRIRVVTLNELFYNT